MAVTYTRPTSDARPMCVEAKECVSIGTESGQSVECGVGCSGWGVEGLDANNDGWG